MTSQLKDGSVPFQTCAKFAEEDMNMIERVVSLLFVAGTVVFLLLFFGCVCCVGGVEVEFSLEA